MGWRVVFCVQKFPNFALFELLLFGGTECFMFFRCELRAIFGMESLLNFVVKIWSRLVKDLRLRGGKILIFLFGQSEYAVFFLVVLSSHYFYFPLKEYLLEMHFANS